MRQWSVKRERLRRHERLREKNARAVPSRAELSPPSQDPSGVCYHWSIPAKYGSQQRTAVSKIRCFIERRVEEAKAVRKQLEGGRAEPLFCRERGYFCWQGNCAVCKMRIIFRCVCVKTDKTCLHHDVSCEMWVSHEQRLSNDNTRKRLKLCKSENEWNKL